MIDEMGLEGYGIFWILVETLREQKDYRYPLRLIPSIARKYNTTPSKIIDVIEKYELFEIDMQSFFFSHSLNRRMSFLAQKREKIVAASHKGVAAKRAKQEQLLLELSVIDSTNHRTTDGEPSKEKESKEKESKEKETLSQESRAERDIFSNLQSFKKHFIQKNTNVPFYTQGIGYEPTTGFKVNVHGYIENMKNNKVLSREQALEVWDYLYNYYQRVS
nr:Lin1244/Lin1753 domain-containing protein [Sulfurimonas denitrificans]